MKKILLLAGILLICGSGYLIYLFGFKEYNIADAEVDTITKEEYVIELADGSKIVLDKYGNLIRHLEEDKDEAVRTEKIKEELADSESTDLAEVSASKETSKAEKEKDAVTSKQAKAKKAKTTVKDIKKKYEPAITDIERQANNSLDNLIEVAKDEYFEMEENDQNISYPYFYNKYSAAATKLEKRTDKIFYAVMEMMEKDLKSNNLPLSLSKSMSKEYEKRKVKIRNDILKNTAGL